jgi:RNA polymerase sigma-70 factor (ECF subfamily)
VLSPDPPPRWPSRLADAAVRLRDSTCPCREHERAALWPLLHAALFASLRAQAGRIAWVNTEDLEDLASQKSLELLLRTEEGAWDPKGRSDHEVAGYVARVARHALVDLARRRGRECAAPEDSEAWAQARWEQAGEPARPEDRLVAREFACALHSCVEALAPRARQAWFRRVFLERPSREIAASLGLTAPHVDVVVQRARIALKRCMEAKGHREEPVRPGVFVELWARFSSEPAMARVEETDVGDR